MTKSAEAFRTISEVAEWLDLPTHVLRFWESKFSQIKPVKRAGGRRYYRPNDMLLIGGIKKLLHSDGLTIKAVQKVLIEQGQKYVCNLSKPLDGSKNMADKKVDEIAVVESGVRVKKVGWKPIGLTKLATDLGEDGKIIEPNQAERDLPDLAIEQIDAMGKLAVEESITSETINSTEAFEPSDAPNGVPGEGISDMNQETNSDLNSQAPEIINVSSGKSKRVSIKETKKPSDLFDDDQPMLNFWASDDETTQNKISKNTEKTAELNDRVIDQAEYKEVDQDLARQNIVINVSRNDAVSDAPAASHAVSAHIDALVTIDNVAQNAKLLEADTAKTPVHATLRSIGDHLDRHPLVSPVQAKALRTGLTALQDAIAKRRQRASRQ